MAEELPNFIDVRRLVDEQSELSGSVPLQRLTRLPPPFRAAAPVSLKLEFTPGEARQIRVSGRLTTAVVAICQRCLNDMRLSIDRKIDVVLTDREPELAEADEHDDFVITQDGKWALAEFAEDELILACPMIPVHEQADCPAQTAAADVEHTQDTRRPFAGLADLLADAGKESGK